MKRGEFRRQDPDLTARLFIAPILLTAIWQTTFAPIEETPGDPGALPDLHPDTFLHALAAPAPDGRAT